MMSSSPRRTWFKRLLTLSLLLSVAGLFVWAWLPKPIEVEIGRVRAEDFRTTVDEDGKTRVKERYTLSAPLGGYLSRPSVRAGDLVQRGQVLAELSPQQPNLLDLRSRSEARARLAASTAAVQQSRASIARTQALVEYAQRELERRRALHAKGAVTTEVLEQADLDLRTRREELASAQFGAQVTQHELEVVRASLGGSKAGRSAQERIPIVAPVEGRILRVLQESEGVVAPGAALFEIGDPRALEAVVDLLSVDAVRVRPGATAIIDGWGQAQRLRAHVRSVEPAAFTRISALGVEEQRVNVVLDFDSPHRAWEGLGDAYRIEAKILVYERPKALQVPASAVFRRENDWVVYRVQGGNARIAKVEIGERNDRAIEIRSGLAAGDRVVVYPGENLRDGVRVKARRNP